MREWWFRNASIVLMASGAVVGGAIGFVAAFPHPISAVVYTAIGALFGMIEFGWAAVIGAILRWWL